MIAVDTNIIIRLLTKDEPTQYEKSKQLFGSEEIFIPDTVLLESEWVLRHAYRFPPDQISAALRGLCGLPNVTLVDPERIALALSGMEAGLDFADALHLANAAGRCQQMMTFDQKFMQRARQFHSFPVREPIF